MSGRATASTAESEIWQLLSSCEICPLRCRVDRLAGRTGGCRVGGQEIWVAKAQLHMWEEPCISGTNGSGTVFFSFCNLRCVFCQNYEISQAGRGRKLTVDELVRLFLRVQEIGAHNLNLVSPTHFLPQVAIALRRARQSGLHLPVVYNTNAYETADALRHLEGLVDVYLPDLKYASDGPGSPARRYSRAPGYFAAATTAIMEMLRQVGVPQFDSDGLICRGLIIRHLVLPGQLDETKAVLRWIAHSLPRSVYVSLMAQYLPVNRSARYPEIDRGLTEAEYEEALDYFTSLGLENGYKQELGAASESFIPRFDLDLAGL